MTPEEVAADKLRRLVPAWRSALNRARLAERRVVEAGRKLATARGVGFIRLEQLETEFGKASEQ